ncbi:shikimate kinase [Sporolactobacillus sp. CQH2019]|uniref:shikimate kinase n=1 Tax=Sporolactobacillus sp. CQH2019 TaxID=3023512 RepID=UPI00236775D7|nr:shikimate kinase [Sporolactobacillus sp. CQH2019]MDD9150778.1 shikimate kinase [Sporolactobacillus sp. CQH2019]
MIYITGFMGAGKTTIGAALSKKLNVAVYDTDLMVEREQNKSVQEIFRDEGEAFFRTCETRVLEKLAVQQENTAAVVTTGGGIVMNPANRTLMKSNGSIIFLYCDIHTIRKRLINDKTRPLVQKYQGPELEALYKKRMAAYLDATHVIHVTAKSVEAIAVEILSLMYQTAPEWVS